MKYDEEYFIKSKKETDKLLKFLQECKFSGSFDTKLDLNIIIRTIATKDFIIDNLRNEIKKLEDDILKLKKENNEKVNKQINEQDICTCETPETTILDNGIKSRCKNCGKIVL